jgi:DHA2 family multidrug resistance protein-like MFS transporter
VTGLAAGLEPGRRAVAVAVVLSSMALVVLDAGVVHVALPTIAGTLRTTPGAAVLVVTAYQAALLMALLPCGALGERYGYRRVFGWGVAVFTIASLFCAIAPSLLWLVAARFLQGFGGAAIMAMAVALLRFSVPAGRLGSAIGWNAMTIALCSAAGPALGALVLSRAGWPWLFAVNLPLGAGILLAVQALPLTEGRSGPIDPVAMALNAALFACLILGAEVLPNSPIAAGGLLIAAGLVLVALIRRESPKAAPLVPLDLLRQPDFRTSVIASVCCFAGQTAALVALPFHLHQLGLTPLETGLYMTAWPLTVAATATAMTRFADGTASAWLCAAGGICLAAGMAGAALWPLDGDPRALIPMMALCGLGFGLFQTPNNRTLFLAAPPDRSGAAGGMQGTARLTGQTAGAVLVTLLFATAATEATPRIAFAAASVLTLAAGLVSLLRVGASRVQPAST